MKLSYFYYLMVLCLFLVSCSQKEQEKIILPQKTADYKVIHNNNQPSDKNFSYKLTKLFTINDREDQESYSNDYHISFPRAFDIDSEGNIFVLGAIKAAIYKFDKNGNFLKKFGRKGEGPGETIEPSFFCIVNDTLYYGGAKTQHVVTCDNEGNFIKKIELPFRNSNPEFSEALKNGNILSQIMYGAKSRSEVQLDNLVFDTKFKTKFVLNNSTFKIKEFTNNIRYFTCSDDKIYIAQNSESKYLIDIYNLEGQLEATIEKDYRKIEFKPIDFNKKKLKRKSYKKSITGLFFDKKRNLLFVKRALERNEENSGKFIVDVFKNNKFIKTIDLGLGKCKDYFNPLLQIKIVGDRLYYKNHELTVYQIEN